LYSVNRFVKIFVKGLRKIKNMVKTSYNKKMRTQNLYKFTSILLFAVLFLTACNGTAAEATPTVDNASVIATSIAQTMQAMAETQAAQVTPTLASTATSAVLPSITVPAANLPTSTVQTVSLPANCLVAGLVSETIPDGTVIGRGSSFTKTWSIRNGGTCTWGTNYKMVFESGEKLGATVDSVALTQSVAPGMMTSVSVKMTAPNVDGTYIGYWDLLSDAGVLVGRFSVNIYVGVATAAPFSVTSVTYPGSFTGLTCDGSNNNSIPITIKTDGAGTVSFTLSDINHVTPDVGDDITVTSAGTYTIYYNMVFPISATGDGVDVDISVYINNPNHQTFLLKNSDGVCK
jgi:hypothetical protein